MNTFILKDEKNHNKKVGGWLALICFATNISQLPILLGNSIVKISLLFFWILLFGYIIFNYSDKLKFSIIPIVGLVMIFDVTILLEQLFIGQGYITSSFIYPVHLSLFILIISYFVGQVSDSLIVNKIAKFHVISSLILALFIYFDTFRGTDWSNSMGYLYKSKNSISQILLIAIVFLGMYYKGKQNFVKWIAIGFLAFLTLMLKSRATIAGLILVVLYFTFVYFKPKDKKLVLILLFFIAVITIYKNQHLYDLIINKILLNNRGNTDLETISSGRIDHLNYFISYFPDKWITGYGNVYLESFPLAALMSYGIIGATPLFILSLAPLYICFRNRKEKRFNKLRTMVIVISIIMLTNGIFEQLAPFGPGVKCYTLWLTTGLYIGLINNKFLEIKE